MTGPFGAGGECEASGDGNRRGWPLPPECVSETVDEGVDGDRVSIRMGGEDVRPAVGSDDVVGEGTFDDVRESELVDARHPHVLAAGLLGEGQLVKCVTAERGVPGDVQAHVVGRIVGQTVLFYVLLVLGDMRWALAGALIWSYGAVVRRVVGERPVPALLILATLGITVRTIVYLLSSNDFVYFVQPILRTTLTGLMFAGSVAVGRPLIARFANDFCPLSPDVRVRPGILRLFKRLTILWSLVNVVAAASSLVLLLTVPVSVFVVTAAVSAWIVTSAGVITTVAYSVTTARHEGLITALSPDGRLYAATVHPTMA